MRTGYSLLVDEYVDANLAEPVDCKVLRICCPVCQEKVVLETEVGKPRFRHAAPKFPSFEAECESRSSEFDPDYCNQHNTRARQRRLEFLKWDRFKQLLGEDPLGPPYKEGGGIWEETPKLLRMGALSNISYWHRRIMVPCSGERLKDPVEFFATAERHLRFVEEKLPDVPESGLRRQVHLQVAFDLLQSLVAREDYDDDYDWLFVHAFRICMGKWVSVAENAQKDQTQSEASEDDLQEHTAAGSILGHCAFKLMSDDRLEAHKAIETLIEVEIGPPVTEERMPFLIFFGADIAGEMQYALHRLPYLPLLAAYKRPCRPLLT
jgi:hypothetical protein